MDGRRVRSARPPRGSSRYPPKVPIRLVAAACAAAALWLAAGVAPAADGSKASATAFAVLVKVAGQDGVTAGYASAPPAASGSASGFAYPGDGSIVTVGSGSTSARTGPGAAANASASTPLERVSLFGGDVNIASVSAVAEATCRRRRGLGRSVGVVHLGPCGRRERSRAGARTSGSRSVTGDTRSCSSRPSSAKTAPAPVTAAS